VKLPEGQQVSMALMQGRAGRLAWIMAMLGGLVALRLLDLQVLRRPFLLARAESQELRKVDVAAKRGNITDRHGEILASSIETESVFCSSKLVKPWERAHVAHELAASLGVNEAEMRRKLAANRPFWVARGAKLEATAKLREAKLGSLSFNAETRRVYPQGSLAAHVLGFTDVDGRGIEGVERSYQAALGGSSGVKEVLKDARGLEMPNQQSWLKRPVEGSALTLTLDSQLQHIAERELDKAYHKFHAKGAALVLMDPRSGEILAMASEPTYDPSEPSKVSEQVRRNRAVVDTFEPGSTFKAVTAALALEKGVVTPDTPVDCHNGSAEFFGRTVRDHGTDHFGVVPFSTVLAQSSNVGTVEVALKLGPKVMYEGMTRFGFGQSTQVDLPGEAVGMVRPLDKWSPGSMAAIPFGQELSCNLMRIAVTYAALANGGTLVTPHVVKAVVSPSGSSREPERLGEARKILGEGVRLQLVKILKGVVEDGTGVAIALPGYTIAGKTGTAQKFDVKTGRYSQTANVATFVGFVPADAPAFVAAVMVDEPQGITLGGWTAGPVFRAVMSSALTAYGISPDEKILAAQDLEASRAGQDPKKSWENMYKRGAQAADVKQVPVPKLLALTERAARAALSQAGLRARVLGQGQVTAQFPRAGQDVLQGSTVTLTLDRPAKPGKALSHTLVASAPGRAQ
jgi:cell division protein FtsI/penicillin-binding protein 2